LDEAGLTVPMTAPPPDSDVANSNGGEKQAAPPLHKTPVLAHRMKHDKSILALVVSSQYIWAGTQGGEILVCGTETTVYSFSS
jgi:di- and tripeptidase